MNLNEWPTSIREINNLPQDEKQAIYRTLIPDWLFTDYNINPETFTIPESRHPVVHMRCPSGTRALELSIRRHPEDLDPMFYLNMADTFNNQLIVLLLVVNDPDSPRFNTDRDRDGNPTHFGTRSRNIPAEEAAMAAGLAPGQIRRGLRSFSRILPVFEQFVERLGQSMFFIEPLAYHNAIVFERYGFSYLRGRKEMERIHQEFQPGGELHRRLTPDNPFRHPDAWKTVRGRSWAIHDGILGYPFTGFQMYKRLGKHAGVNTFPDAIW
ncbi:MAG: hypothetical protein D6712_03465 [Chloroflexi bacterium]|nr:MAG: hypothetical protein D6712_03465 [Chloroflexota bacterium]